MLVKQVKYDHPDREYPRGMASKTPLWKDHLHPSKKRFHKLLLKLLAKLTWVQWAKVVVMGLGLAGFLYYSLELVRIYQR